MFVYRVHIFDQYIQCYNPRSNNFIHLTAACISSCFSISVTHSQTSLCSSKSTNPCILISHVPVPKSLRGRLDRECEWE